MADQDEIDRLKKELEAAKDLVRELFKKYQEAKTQGAQAENEALKAWQEAAKERDDIDRRLQNVYGHQNGYGKIPEEGL